MTCYIVAAGELCPGDLDFTLQPEDLLIAADGGYASLQTAGRTPHLFVGDGDSLGTLPTDCPTVALPVEKDDTDLLAAAKEGLARGCTEFVILGGLGGRRFSHSVANLQVLAWLARHRAHGCLRAGTTRVELLTRTTRFCAGCRGSISLFAYGGPAVVSLAGLKYPLRRKKLTPSFPLGVSNAFTGQPAAVTLHKGRVLAIWEEE